MESDEEDPNIKSEQVSEALRSSTVLLERIKLITSKAAEPVIRTAPKEVQPVAQRLSPSEECLTVAEFWELIEGITIGQESREKLVRYTLMTDFSSSLQYSHLECFKEQLQEIENVIDAVGANAPESSKHILLSIQILSTIVKAQEVEA